MIRLRSACGLMERPLSDVTGAYFDAGGNAAMELWTGLSSPLGLAAITGIFLLIGYLIYRYIGGCYCAVNL